MTRLLPHVDTRPINLPYSLARRHAVVLVRDQPARQCAVRDQLYAVRLRRLLHVQRWPPVNERVLHLVAHHPHARVHSLWVYVLVCGCVCDFVCVILCVSVCVVSR